MCGCGIRAVNLKCRAVDAKSWGSATKARLPARRLARPNALKHGAFSAIEFLPWEDHAAFEDLRQELWNDTSPKGLRKVIA